MNAELARIADEIERKTDKNNLGHGEHVCQFCNGRGHVEVEHEETCPISKLWGIVNKY